jgi:phage major head subunit gpT-like protein
MLITSAELNRLFQNFNFNFISNLGTRPVYHPKVAMRVPSSTTEEIHSWLAARPKMRRVKSGAPRSTVGFAAHDYSLTNEDFYDRGEISVNRLEDDTYGVLAQVPKTFAVNATQYPDDYMFETIEDGTATDCWDGEYFFSGAHPNDFDRSSAGTFRNRYDSNVAGGSTAYALTQANVQTGCKIMASYVDEAARPLGLRPKYLMVPPALELTADEICKGPSITRIVQNVAADQNVAAAAPSNMMQGKIEPLVIDRLTSDTAWYLIAEVSGELPFIFQERKAPVYQMITDPNHPSILNDRQVLHWVEARGAFGFGRPQLAIRFDV